MKERIELKTFTKMSPKSLVDYKDLIEEARILGQEQIAITDLNSVEVFPKVSRYMKESHIEDLKIIYGATLIMKENSCEIPVTVLVRSEEGLKNLYKLISIGKTVTRDEFVEYSSGLLYGISLNFMMSIYENQTDDQVGDDLMWYDFILVSPSKDHEYLKRMIKIAELNRKIVVATNPVHYVRKEDQKDYQLLFPDETGEHHLKSTEEMMKDFQFLEDEKLIREIIVEKPHRLVGLIGEVEILSETMSLPSIKNSQEIFLKMVYDNAHFLYGENLPSLIQKRIEEELYGKEGKGLLSKNYEVIYLIYQKLVEHSETLGYHVVPRGKVASSFLAYLIGITDINPLPPHYYCPNCKEILFSSDEHITCGIDLPSRVCEKCQKEMKRDGFVLPYETFLGYEGNRMPDIDLNFSETIVDDLIHLLKDMFGENSLYRGGVIGVHNKASIQKMLENASLEDKERISNKGEGIKRVKGVHPTTFFVIPQEKEVYDFTPIESLPNGNLQMTHFDYHDLKDNLLKLDILVHEIPDKLKIMEDITHRKARFIPLNDKSTWDMILKGDTERIPEFDCEKTKKLILEKKPTTFEELVKILGISHRVGIFENKHSSQISCREDILSVLEAHQMDRKRAFEIMEFISLGKIRKEENFWDLIKQEMQEYKVEESFINECSQIEFLLPKAHLVSYAVNVFRISWFKAHFPKRFQREFL